MGGAWRRRFIMIRIKRSYDPVTRSDGRRVLVERLWPRGMKKEALAADDWMKDVAPSTGLRQWFAHRVERWDEFRRRYMAELDEHPEAWRPLLVADGKGSVTLLYSAHDVLHNSALVLRDYLAAHRGFPAASSKARERPRKAAPVRRASSAAPASRRTRKSKQ
jgi:uncharacterized protein YeaO (DUF488 family)